jgi:hypothetical protein
VFSATAILVGLVGYFVKISKEGKRLDRVKDAYNDKCPLSADESQELSSKNNVKYIYLYIVESNYIV